MDELERHLRSALVELAEEVPPSHNAWADQERRLALKSRRARVRPVLLAAVAAAVVALIAVPVVIFNLRPSGTQAGSLPTEEPPSTASSAPTDSSPPSRPGSHYVAIPGEKLITEPVSVDTVQRQDGQWQVYVYTVQRSGLQQMCSIPLPYGVKINGADQAKYGNPVCMALIPPKSGRLLWFKGFLPNSSDGLYVYVMAPNVQTVLVRTSDNSWRLAYRMGDAGPDFAVLVARLGSPAPPKAYTARDGNDGTLENG